MPEKMVLGLRARVGAVVELDRTGAAIRSEGGAAELAARPTAFGVRALLGARMGISVPLSESLSVEPELLSHAEAERRLSAPLCRDQRVLLL